MELESYSVLAYSLQIPLWFCFFDACLIALTEASEFSVIMIDSKIFYYAGAVTIRQLLEELLL
jgi:hypothetical protein